MPLTPDLKTPELYQSDIKPSRTYYLDFANGEIKGMVDGRAAIEQFIHKVLKTPRYRYPIYSANYGCEIDQLIGQGFTGPFIEAEIIRVTTEALIYDERVDRVYNFDITADGDNVWINFTVDTAEGTLEISEVFANV